MTPGIDVPPAALPPHDFIEVAGGFALLVDIGPCQDFEVEPERHAIRVSGTHSPEFPFPYLRMIAQGRSGGLFDHMFPVPRPHQIVGSDAIEASILNGVLAVVILTQQ